MAKIKNEHYITIQEFMVNDLELSGNELIAYALIYGFSQDGESYFKGSLSYVSKWLNCSKATACTILNKLADDGFLEKKEKNVNGVRLCDYTTYPIDEKTLKEIKEKKKERKEKEKAERYAKKLNTPSKNRKGYEKNLNTYTKKLNGGMQKTLTHNTTDILDDMKDENIDDNLDIYALKDVKKSSFKGNMYASVPEEQEAAAPKKQSRYISKGYTEEQLKEHIKPVVKNEVKQYIEDCDVNIPDDTDETFANILFLFCNKYKQCFGENHYVMPDKTIRSAVRRYLEPPEEMDCVFSLEEYEELIDLYFRTDFNKIGKFKDENGRKKKVVLSFPHFMSDTIRGNLANRLWK